VNLRRSDADSLEKFRVEKGELYHLTQLTNLLRQTCTPTAGGYGYEKKGAISQFVVLLRGRPRK
jgi:hypothetical protein